MNLGFDPSNTPQTPGSLNLASVSKFPQVLPGMYPRRVAITPFKRERIISNGGNPRRLDIVRNRVGIKHLFACEFVATHSAPAGNTYVPQGNHRFRTVLPVNSHRVISNTPNAYRNSASRIARLCRRQPLTLISRLFASTQELIPPTTTLYVFGQA